MREFSKIIGIGFIIGIILFLIYLIFQSISGETIVFNNKLLIIFGYYQLYSIPISIVNSYYFDYIHRKEGNKKFIKYRLFLGVLGSIIITLLTVFLVRAFQEMSIEGETYEEFMATERLSFYFTSLIITIVFSVFFHALYFYKELQKRKVTKQKIIAGTASAQFDALKNQLDPHFLFNSLNVLSSLIDENPRQAQKFTTALSKVYRYVLEQKNKELVTIDEELQFAKTYMSLVKMRFEDSIIFEAPERSTNPESKVVPLSLQLLLENAVKHNIVTPSKPLHIRIYEESGNLVVQNNLQEKQIVKKSSGVGLSNIEQRYNLLTQKQVEIHKSVLNFQVAIPMLTKQIEVMRSSSSDINLDDKYINARKHVGEIKGFLLQPCFVLFGYSVFNIYQLEN